MREAGNRGKGHLSYWEDASWRTHIFYALQSAPCNTGHSIISILGANTLKTEFEASTHHIRRGEGSVVETGSEISDHLQDFVVWNCGVDLLQKQRKTHHTNEPDPQMNTWMQPCTWALFSLSSCCWSRRLSLFSCSFSTSFTQFDFLLAVKKKRKQNSTTYSTICKNNVTQKGFCAHPKPKNLQISTTPVFTAGPASFLELISTKQSHKHATYAERMGRGCDTVPPALVHLLPAMN